MHSYTQDLSHDKIRVVYFYLSLLRILRAVEFNDQTCMLYVLLFSGRTLGKV
ncbi:hypothetical protein SCLCIDRAFT_1208564 [Scleroderma citrinum Foug A]|uniref:Uncharacterized protein n=1 Tax=Scleroderma citrinum Foug A TaxID=1036808 RepID=A0A0C3A627_9AGAM|nr:hypothetical protein SCLCIDRAFT_1208564 [Scleroderma citrinum Foug A]